MVHVRASLVLSIVVLLALSGARAGTRQPDVALPGPQSLAQTFERERLPMPLPPLLRHADVERAIERLRSEAPDLVSVERIGESVEGRAIYHLAIGRGPFGVLLWSQMHGDEPTATVALFDVLEYIRRRQQDPVVGRLLDRLTLHIVPMLNPDGAERFTRRNAQGIDINRDALALQTPEGRALKALRDRLEPKIGFNLHNQNWRTSVGDTGKPAAMSLLAVAYDEARSDNEGRILAKKLCSVIRTAVEPLAPGMIGRYDDEFELRAFGDNITKWGTSVVLIETGPYPGPDPDSALVAMNYVAILTALDALASGRAHEADPKVYESLPFNDSRLFHTLVRNATIFAGTGVPPFLGDLGFAASRVVRRRGGNATVGFEGRLEDLGDLRVFGALESIDATGLAAAPLWRKDLEVGDVVSLPDRPLKGPTLSPGQPAAAVLLKPASAPGRYEVHRIIRIE